jgi:hypothetical protein
MLKEIEIKGTSDTLKVKMDECGNSLKFSWGLEAQYEDGPAFTKWVEVACFNFVDGEDIYTEWKLSPKMNNEQGTAIVQEIADTFEAEVIEWQMKKANATLDPNGTLKPMHIAFLYSVVKKVQVS